MNRQQRDFPRARRTVPIALLALLTSVALPAGEIDDLRWLAGCWASEEGGERSEECWLHPDGEMMLGLNRTVSPGGSGFEFLRIDASGEGVVYLASPSGRPAVAFPLIESGDHFAVFANPQHDFPQRITYRRDGDSLTAAVEALEEGRWNGFTLSWQRSTLEGSEGPEG